MNPTSLEVTSHSSCYSQDSLSRWFRHLKRKNQKSILFFTPDYHCSFFLRDELRKRGWKADIFVPSTYPEQFLYDDKDVIVEKIRFSPAVSPKNAVVLFIAQVRRARLQMRYRYILHYGSLGQTVSKDSLMKRLFHLTLLTTYRVLKVLGTHIIYLPSGCRNERSRAEWQKLDGGNVCRNCGYADQCDDKVNNANFELVRKAASAAIGWDPQWTDEYKQTFIRYKSLDLDVYHPEISVPPELKLPRKAEGSVIVLHSYVMTGRNFEGRNIKGSSSVLASIDRLVSQGHNVELYCPQDIHAREMRFIQVQADVVVDQLIYGTLGSTSLEALALGKPVVCYVRDSWREFLANRYPEWEKSPIISATPDTLDDRLTELITDDVYRHQVGVESRRFAEKFLDVRTNAAELEGLLLAI